MSQDKTDSGGYKVELEAKVFLHYPRPGGRYSMHIDVEGPAISEIIRPGERTYASGKKGGCFVALRKEMVARAPQRLDGGTRLDDYMPSTTTLDDILSDREHGSSEICGRIIEWVRSADENSVKKGLKDIRDTHGYMAQVFNLCTELLAQRSHGAVLKKAEAWEKTLAGETGRLAEDLLALWPDGARKAATLSRSGTVLRGLQRLAEAGRLDSVYVHESRPGFEGRLTAYDLSYLMEVFLLTDGAVHISASEADALVLGCDGYTSHAFVNKVGSRAAVEAFIRNDRPVFVLCGRTKYVSRWEDYIALLKDKDVHPADEVGAPEGVKVINRYFEEIPRKGCTFLEV